MHLSNGTKSPSRVVAVIALKRAGASFVSCIASRRSLTRLQWARSVCSASRDVGGIGSNALGSTLSASTIMTLYVLAAATCDSVGSDPWLFVSPSVFTGFASTLRRIEQKIGCRSMPRSQAALYSAIASSSGSWPKPAICSRALPRAATTTFPLQSFISTALAKSLEPSLVVMLSSELGVVQ